MQENDNNNGNGNNGGNNGNNGNDDNTPSISCNFEWNIVQGDGLWLNLGGECTNLIPAADNNEGSEQSFSAECLVGDACVAWKSAAGSVIRKCILSDAASATDGYLQYFSSAADCSATSAWTRTVCNTDNCN